ncbi:MAG: hypothetical protein GC187_11530 [Alphaproteobacteria bacterium]|nr:hypothetical protein [Alphaproteobacteria bacterium]
MLLIVTAALLAAPAQHMVHRPAPPPPPLVCDLTRTPDPATLTASCPDAPDAQALVQASLDAISLPEDVWLASGSVTVLPADTPPGWSVPAQRLAFRQPNFPPRALERGDDGYCLTGGVVGADGALIEPRSACTATGDEQVRQAFVYEAQRVTPALRVIGEHNGRCIVLPMIFRIGGDRAPLPAPDSSEVCPAEEPAPAAAP